MAPSSFAKRMYFFLLTLLTSHTGLLEMGHSPAAQTPPTTAPATAAALLLLSPPPASMAGLQLSSLGTGERMSNVVRA
jgi:hypothetical protein